MFPNSNRAPIERPLGGTVKDVGVAGKPIRIELPVGLTFLDLEFYFSIAGNPASKANLKAMLGNMRCFLDGELRYDVPVSEYIDVYSFHADRIQDTGFLPILMSLPWNQDPNTPAKPGADQLGAMINPAWGTKNHASFVFEIDQLGGSTIDAVTVLPVLHPVPTDLGLHLRPVRMTHNLNTLGQSDWIMPFRERGAFLYSLHFLPPVLANLTNIRVMADGVPYKDGTVTQHHRRLTRPVYKKNIQTGWAHVDLCARNLDDDALPLATIDDSLLLQLTFANVAPGTFPIWAIVASPDTRAASAA